MTPDPKTGCERGLQLLREMAVPPSTAPPLTREAALDLAQRNSDLTTQNHDLRTEVGALRAELTEAKAIASWLLVILFVFVVCALLFTDNPITRRMYPDSGHVTQESTNQGGTQR